VTFLQEGKNKETKKVTGRRRKGRKKEEDKEMYR
jgi:hypothetical protein